MLDLTQFSLIFSVDTQHSFKIKYPASCLNANSKACVSLASFQNLGVYQFISLSINQIRRPLVLPKKLQILYLTVDDRGYFSTCEVSKVINDSLEINTFPKRI